MFIDREAWTCTFKNFDSHVKEERVRRVLEKDDEEKRKAEKTIEDDKDEKEADVQSNADSKAFSTKEKVFGDNASNKSNKQEKVAKKEGDRGELDLDEKDIRIYLRKERNMDSGFKILREKVPFQW